MPISHTTDMPDDVKEKDVMLEVIYPTDGRSTLQVLQQAGPPPQFSPLYIVTLLTRTP